MTTERIGFIGIGSMGAGMAMRLLEAGYRLTVYDTNAGAVAALRDRGAKVVDSPRAVADMSEIVFACLPSPDVSREVALEVGKGRAVSIYIETSTIGIDTVNIIESGLRDAGIGFLDAPVSGGPDGARTGTLSTIIAGERTHFERARLAIGTFASKTFYVGGQPGQAQLAKLINNLLSATAKIITFEGIALGLEAGLDSQVLIDFINVSTGRNMATLEAFPDRVLRLFRSKAGKSISVKDTELFLIEAERLGVPLSLAPKVLQALREGAGYGQTGTSHVMAGYVEQLKELDKKRVQSGDNDVS